jgi:hypothetical protein
MPRKSVNEKEIVVSAAVPARVKKPAAKRATRTAPAVSATVVEALAVPEKPPMALPQQIAALAYSYWEARGCQGGSPEEDWLRAEQQLTAAAIA